MRLSGVLFAVVALVGWVLLPLGTALAYPPANPVRALPSMVDKGETFNVTVNFTAPANNFFLVSLSDIAPNGWNVTVNTTWCTPNAEFVNATENKAEIMWYGEPGVGFDKDTSLTALYKVTVPDDAELGIYAFSGSVEYYVGAEGPYLENVTSDSQIEVVAASGIIVWWIVGIVVGIAIIVVAVLLVRRRGT